jgi:hypothetical protein
MPFRVEMLGDLLHVTFSGVLSVEALKRLSDAIRDIEATLNPTPSRIVDMSGITGVSIGFDAMSELAEVRRLSPVRNAIKSALVAPGQLQMGFARMFQQLNSHPRVIVEVFRDRESALAWLALPLELPPA